MLQNTKPNVILLLFLKNKSLFQRDELIDTAN